jgi:hypothetical protein
MHLINPKPYIVFRKTKQSLNKQLLYIPKNFHSFVLAGFERVLSQRERA